MTRKRDSFGEINLPSSQPMLLRIGPLLDPHPAFGLPIGSSVAQSTALPSLGTAWRSANPLKTSLRPLEEGTVQSPQGEIAK